MAYIITDTCGTCKDTGCVTVCPCDCIAPLPDADGFADEPQLYIDPDACIDCGLCATECPVEAIYTEEDLTPDLAQFVQINLDYFANPGPDGGS